MTEDSDFIHPQDDYTNNLIREFEQMLSSGTVRFYDVEQFEDIIEYYTFNTNWKRVKQTLDIAKSQHPGSSELKFREAEYFSNIDKYDEALALLNQIHVLESNNPEFYFIKADVQSRAGKPIDAIKTLEALIDFASDDDLEDAYLAIAKEYEELNMQDEALAYLKMVLERNPSNDDALYEVGFIFETINKTNEAIEFYKWFLDNNPYSEHAWFSLGNIYLFDNQLEKAAHAFDYAGIVNPEFAAAFFNLGNCYMKMGRYEDAIQAFESSVNFELLDPVTYNYIGLCHMELNRMHKAELSFRISIEKDPEYAEGWLGIAMALARQDRFMEAKHYAHKAVKLDENNGNYHYFYANLLTNIAQLDEAQKHYRSAIEKGVLDPMLFIDYATSFFENGMSDKALEVITEGIEANPDNGRLYYRYVAFLIALKKFDLAQAYLYMALEIAPDQVDDLFKFYPDAQNIEFVIELIEDYKNEL